MMVFWNRFLHVFVCFFLAIFRALATHWPLQNGKPRSKASDGLYKITNMGSAVVVPSTKSTICQNANKQHIKQKEKRGGAPNFTQRIIDFEKENACSFGWVRASFFGYKMAPAGAREPKTSLKFRHSMRYLYKTVAANPSMMVFWNPVLHAFVYFV